VDQYGDEIACVIMEPLQRCTPPVSGFLEGVRKITQERGILLIFDEVITGFRAAYGGAQEIYKIKADMTCLGKVIGGGLPVGAYGGKKTVMDKVSPLGAVYQAGTLSGNPLAMTAGITTLELLKAKKNYQDLDKKTLYLTDKISECAEERGIPFSINRTTGMFTLFFTEGPVKDYRTAKMSDTKRFAQFFIEMMNQGIYLPPSQYEAWFISLAHTQRDLDKTIEACEAALKKI